MHAITIDFAEAENDFLRVAAEVNRTRRLVTVLKDNGPWVVIQLASAASALESALAQPFQSFAGEDLYPGTAEKAERLCFGIVVGHPFIDGNKRTGAALLGAFPKGSTPEKTFGHFLL